MAKMPNALDKREYVFGTRGTPEDCRRLAEACLERDWTADAVALFARTDEKERLEELLERALEDGDVFLAERVTAVLGVELEEGQWRRLGDRALTLEKYRFAAVAFEKLDDASALRLVSEKAEAVDAALAEIDGKARGELAAVQAEQDDENED